MSMAQEISHSLGCHMHFLSSSVFLYWAPSGQGGQINSYFSHQAKRELCSSVAQEISHSLDF